MSGYKERGFGVKALGEIAIRCENSSTMSYYKRKDRDLIRLIATGGTFEKRYNDSTFKMDLDDSVIPEILTTGRCRKKVRYERLLTKISSKFTESDFKKIVERCKECRESRIVITHGTVTIDKTAKLLINAKLKKTIVLVGAFVPYTVSNSDAAFNLGFALASAQTLSQGVYVAMNGEVFDGDNVKKNKKTSVFEKLV